MKKMLWLLILGNVLLVWLPLLALSEFASDFELLVGRLHPSLVHFPIGLLLVTIVFEVLRRKGRLDDFQSAIGLLLYVGAWAAVVASGSGLLLSRGGGYDANTLFWHRFIGIGIASTSTAVWVLFSGVIEFEKSRVAVAALLPLLFVGLIVGGHFGGDLTHHEGYLTRYLPDGIRSFAGLPVSSEIGKLRVSDPESTTVFEAIIRPIIENRCIACHNNKTTRGSLSLLTQESMLEGGSDGPAVVPGDALDSRMIQRIWLPPGDPDHMPPRDRPQITVAEAEILRWWINSGASVAETIETMEPPSELQAIFLAYGLEERETGIFALSLPWPDTLAISAARGTGLQISFLAENHPYVEVSCVGAEVCLNESQADALQPLLSYVAVFDARESELSDSAVEVISQFEHLIHARLEKTGMTDTSMHLLGDFKFLEVLNIYGTNVTDAGIQELATLPALRALYAWQTEVTEEGASTLRLSLPRIDVNLGAGL